MSNQIESLACAISESIASAKTVKETYLESLLSRDDLLSELTAALIESGCFETIAIQLNDHEFLICTYHSLNSYEFTIVRRYN